MRRRLFSAAALAVALWAPSAAAAGRCERVPAAAARAASRRHRPAARRPAPKYRLWRIVCFTQETPGKLCLAFVSADPGVFNREDMAALGAALSKRFGRRPKVKAYIFDDPAVAEGHATFRAELRGIEQRMRGLFYRYRPDCEEYLKFSSEKGRPWDEITINMEKGGCGKR